MHAILLLMSDEIEAWFYPMGGSKISTCGVMTGVGVAARPIVQSSASHRGCLQSPRGEQTFAPVRYAHERRAAANSKAMAMIIAVRKARQLASTYVSQIKKPMRHEVHVHAMAQLRPGNAA